MILISFYFAATQLDDNGDSFTKAQQKYHALHKQIKTQIIQWHQQNHFMRNMRTT